jgi:hypothetical protein
VLVRVENESYIIYILGVTDTGAMGAHREIVAMHSVMESGWS